MLLRLYNSMSLDVYNPITLLLLIVTSNNKFSFSGALQILLDLIRFALGVEFCSGVWGDYISG